MVTSFFLDHLPPSTNSLYTTGAHGRRILVKDGRAYKQYVVASAMASFRGQELEQRSHWRVALEFHMGRATYNRRDLNNMDKLIVDGIAEAMGVDDMYLQELVLRKLLVEAEDTGVLVTIWI